MCKLKSIRYKCILRSAPPSDYSNHIGEVVFQLRVRSPDTDRSNQIIDLNIITQLDIYIGNPRIYWLIKFYFGNMFEYKKLTSRTAISKMATGDLEYFGCENFSAILTSWPSARLGKLSLFLWCLSFQMCMCAKKKKREKKTMKSGTFIFCTLENGILNIIACNKRLVLRLSLRTAALISVRLN